MEVGIEEGFLLDKKSNYLANQTTSALIPLAHTSPLILSYLFQPPPSFLIPIFSY